MYWYLTKGSKYPKNRRVVTRIVKPKYILFALTVEADKNAVEECKLTYLGYGELSDRKIQVALMKVK